MGLYTIREDSSDFENSIVNRCNGDFESKELNIALVDSSNKKINLDANSAVSLVISDMETEFTRDCEIVDATSGLVKYTFKSTDDFPEALLNCTVIIYTFDENDDIIGRLTVGGFKFKNLKNYADSYTPAAPINTTVNMIGYYQTWDDTIASFIPVDDISNRYSEVVIAYGYVSDVGILIYDGTLPTFPSVDEIKALQDKGVKVLLSIEAATNQFTLPTTAAKNIFTASLVNVMTTNGFDGYDISVRGIFKATTDPNQVQTDVTTQNFIDAIKNAYDDVALAGKMLTISPRAINVVHSRSIADGEEATISGRYSDEYGSYLPLIHQLRDKITWVAPQMYNDAFFDKMVGEDGKNYGEGTADYITNAVLLLGDGYVTTTGYSFAGLGHDRIAIGLPGHPSMVLTGYVLPSVLNTAIQNLKALDKPPYGFAEWSMNWAKANKYIMTDQAKISLM